MVGQYKAKPPSRNIPNFDFKDSAGITRPVYWQLEYGKIYFRAVDIWQAVTRSSGHFTRSRLKLTDKEADALKEFRFAASPATRPVLSLSINLALTVCERCSPFDMPTPVEKWIRDKVAPAVGESVSSSAAAMLARAKNKPQAPVKPSVKPVKPSVKPVKPPVVPSTPELFAPAPGPLFQAPVPPSPIPAPTAPLASPQPQAAPIPPVIPASAMLRAELDDETLAYTLFFPDAAEAEAEFEGQGYALPAVSPVPGQTLWPARLGIACDDFDALFSLTAEEAARLETCLWMHKSADGSQRRVLDSVGWSKARGFASVKSLPDQHKALTTLFEGGAAVFAAQNVEPDPGSITVVSEPTARPEAPAKSVGVYNDKADPGSIPVISEPAKSAGVWRVNAPQPDIAHPAQPTSNAVSPKAPQPPAAAQPPVLPSNGVMPGRKLSYWALTAQSAPVRVGQDGSGQLWVAKIDLERILGEEGAWPYDVRDLTSGKIMHDSKIYSGVCETAIPLIVASALVGAKTEGLKFAKWWADTVQISFGQTKPINQVWPVPGERATCPTMFAKPFPYVYNGRLVCTIWVAQDAENVLWIMRRDLENVLGPLQQWPRAAQQSKRAIIENEYGRYPGISEDVIDIVAQAEKTPSGKAMGLDFSLWFNQDVAPKFAEQAFVPQPRPQPRPRPRPQPSLPPLEGELMDFFFKGVRFELIVAVDDGDDIWAEIGPLENVLGVKAQDWPRETLRAPVRDILFKGGVRPAIQEKWLEVIAGCSPFRARAEAFTAWWLAEVMPHFDTEQPQAPAPIRAEAPVPPSPQPTQPVQPEDDEAEFSEIALEQFAPKPATFFLPIKMQEVSQPMSKQARELANLLMSMADALDSKDRENEQLRSQLAERDEDRAKLQAIQAALGFK